MNIERAIRTPSAELTTSTMPNAVMSGIVPEGREIERLTSARSLQAMEPSPPRSGELRGIGRRYALLVEERPAPFDDQLEEWVAEAIESLPEELRAAMSNVAIVVENEPPSGQPVLGLYQGLPLTRRGSSYGAVPPDKITIYRGPLERYYGGDRDRLQLEVRRVVLHEIAHHFGIGDDRLREMGRY
jgi:predicted Zn-dependent protease with MMP-like domain